MVTQRSQRRVQDRYDLLEALGRGGMGTVWLAEDSVLQRKVAVKQVEFPPGVPNDEVDSMRARVMREARAAARLNHPNVTTIYDVLSDDGATWIVMEYVPAPTVTEIVSREGPLSVQRTAQIGLGVLSALEAAHGAGIIHRDVKPGNVMVSANGNVKLADFGVAAVQGDPKITMTGLIIGSPSYMAPEQAQEGVSTAASDMWGLGTTLYFAVEGRPAFDKGAAIPTLTAVTYEPPATMSRAGALEPVLLGLLEKKPDARPTSGELRVLLEEIAADGSSAPAAAAAARASTIYLDEATPAPTAVQTSEQWADEEPWADDDDEPGRRSAWPWVLAALALLVVAGLTLPSLLDGDDETAVADRDVTQEDADRVARRERAAQRQEEAAAGAGAAEDPAVDDTAAEDTAAEDTQDTAAEQEPAAPDDSDAADEQPAALDDSVAVPADWSQFTVGDTGTTVAHPADWNIVNRGATTNDITDPNGGRYLRVQYTDTPKDDAVEDWQRQSQSFDANHANYRQVAIEPYDYPGAETAALWEYTYTERGADLHAYNLAIVIGGRGYALNFQTHQDRWADSQQLWEQFVAGFEPTR